MEQFDIVLGHRDVWGKSQPFGLFAPDRRRGLYIIGQTGVGKSTLLRSMIRQDIEKGRGAILIDPHGDLADEVLSDIPKSRVRDTMLIDAADREHVVSITGFYKVPKSERALVTNNYVSAFRHIWYDSWSTTRLQYILTNVIAALLDAPDYLRPSLLSIPLVLANEHYRSRVVKHIEDPHVRLFFEQELGKWSDRYLGEALGPIQNRIGQFLVNPTLRNMLGQWRPSIDIESVLDEQKILIVRLAKGLIGEEPASLLGAMIIAMIQSAAMKRARIPERDRTDIPLIIDEFQTVTSTSSAVMFAEGRKYGLMLTVAHQFLNQLIDEVRDAVFGNVGSMIAFRTGARDAETVAQQIGSYEPSAYRSLPIGEAYARLLVRGESTDPFRAATLPIAGGCTPAIRSWNHHRHCRKQSDVEAEIIGFFQKPWIVGGNK